MVHRFGRLGVAAAAVTMLWLLPAAAQEVPSGAGQLPGSGLPGGTLPGSALPSHIQERLPAQPEAPSVAPPISVGHEQVTAPAGAAALKFRLSSIALEGNHAIATAALSPIWAKDLGHQITLAELFAIADSITVKYRNSGYILARAIVPPQHIANGVARIRVVEGYIDQVHVNGGTPGGKDLVEAIAAHLTEARPLTSAVLERYLLLLNDLPGVGVRSVVAPSATTPGAATLTIDLTQKLESGYVSLDNRGSRYAGPVQSTFDAQINSLFNRYNATEVQFLTTPYRPDELLYGSITHVEPLDSEGTTLSITGNYAATHPESQLAPFAISADSLYLSLLVQHPFIRSRAQNLYGRISVDYRDASTDLYSGSTVLYKDRLRSVRLGGTYNILDPLLGTDEGTLVLSQGLPILNASPSGGPELSHAAGQSTYTKLNLDLSRLQPLGGKWSLLLGASGQYAFEPLLVSEEFGLGGTIYDRAFDPSELLGDDALAGKLELRYSDAPGRRFLKAYQLYTYFDAGEVWILRSPVGDPEHARAESFGIGARFDFNDTFSGSLEGALPIGRAVAAYAPAGGRAPRLFFSLTARF
jgi:hemolysin activation/secretion protein